MTPPPKEREEGEIMNHHHPFRPILALLLLTVLLTGCVQSPAENTDTIQPTVTTVGNLQMQLLGDPALTLEFGEAYTDPGVTVTWNGQAVEAEVNTDLPELNVLGDHAVTYTAVYQGVTATLTRTVTVVDTQPPTITLLSQPGTVTEIGETYQEEGFTAEDNYDGDLTAKVQRSQEGDVIFYTVTDSAGNTVTVTRTVIYGDSVAPTVTLLGDTQITIMAGETFEEPGYSAADNVDGDITGSVIVNQNYDRYQPGTYIITYTVRDAHGNTAQAQRTLTVQGYVQPDTVVPEGKVIYLTFDDGPSSHTPRLLSILKKYNVKATFFVVGSGELEYLDDIVDGGHAIAIHSNSHEYSKIYKSEEAFFKDFFAIRDKIYDRTGVMTTLCRFPGGSSNRVSKKYCTGIMTKLTKAVEAQGFQYFDWNVDSNDAGGAKDSYQVFQNVINGIRGKQYSVVLQHDIHGYSVDAVERIIQWGLANGYTFMALDPTSPNAHHDVRN